MIFTPSHRPCNQCGAEPGEQHRDWDDIARCAISGIQAIQCFGSEDTPCDEDIEEYGSLEEAQESMSLHEGKCELSIWDGAYPGEKQCVKYGMFTSPDSIYGVRPDLNTLYQMADWNPEIQQLEMSDEALERYRKRSARIGT